MEERHELDEYRKMKEKQFEEDEERRLKIEMSVKKLPLDHRNCWRIFVIAPPLP